MLGRPMAAEVAERTVRIKNSAGLHARPCHAFVTVAAAHKASLRVQSGGAEVDGKSILSLMTLGAPVEAELRLRAEGEDAMRRNTLYLGIPANAPGVTVTFTGAADVVTVGAYPVSVSDPTPNAIRALATIDGAKPVRVSRPRSGVSAVFTTPG